jgi:hypothetical protein
LNPDPAFHSLQVLKIWPSLGCFPWFTWFFSLYLSYLFFLFHHSVFIQLETEFFFSLLFVEFLVGLENDSIISDLSVEFLFFIIYLNLFILILSFNIWYIENWSSCFFSFPFKWFFFCFFFLWGYPNLMYIITEFVS